MKQVQWKVLHALDGQDVCIDVDGKSKITGKLVYNKHNNSFSVDVFDSGSGNLVGYAHILEDDDVDITVNSETIEIGI